jgi:hypothetical protein
MNELDLEESIQAKGLTAPRLTPALIDATIVYAEYFRVPNTTCTICALILKNGYIVVGKSAAVSMANFDEDIGKQIAYSDAREQIWALEGYALKDSLYKYAI